MNLLLHDPTRPEPIKNINQDSLLFLIDTAILVNRKEHTMTPADPKNCSLDNDLISFIDDATFEAYLAAVATQ